MVWQERDKRGGIFSEKSQLAFLSDRLLLIIRSDNVHDFSRQGREEILRQSTEWLEDSVSGGEAIQNKNFSPALKKQFQRYCIANAILREYSGRHGIPLDFLVEYNQKQERGKNPEPFPLYVVKDLLEINQKLIQGGLVSEEALERFRGFWETMRNLALIGEHSPDFHFYPGFSTETRRLASV